MRPILFSIGDFHLYSYPLFMGLAWGVAYHLSKFYLRSKGCSLKGFNALFISTFVMSWLGAKIFFLLFSAPLESGELSARSSFWLGGGFVFYGGAIFGILNVLLFCGVLKKFPLEKTYLLIPGLTVGHGIGRIGCFLVGCCHGTVCELPWAIQRYGKQIHPVQLYEALYLFILTFVLHRMIKAGRGSFNIVVMYLVSYSIGRFVLEYFRGDKIRGIHLMDLSTSQWVSVILLLVTLGIITFKKVTRRLP